MSSDTQCLASETYLAKFALEFINNKILVESYLTGTKKYNRHKKLEAVIGLAVKLDYKGSIVAMLNMCVKLRTILFSRLKRLVKHCIYRNWPVKRCLLLAPHWIRIVETKIRLIPKVIKLAVKLPLPPASKYSVFYNKLVKNAHKAAKDGESMYSHSVVSSVASDYETTDHSVLALWKRTCEVVKWGILSKSDNFDVFPYFNINCQIADCLLLYDTNFKIVTLESFSNERELRSLLKLYKLVIKYDVENLMRNRSPDLVLAWLKLFAVYSSEGKKSLLYLQRCWYELKQEARVRLCLYCREEEGSVPHPLLMSILSNFRYINLEPLLEWSELVKMGLVVQIKDVSKKMYDEALNEAMNDYDMNHCTCTDHKYTPLKRKTAASVETRKDQEDPTVGHELNLRPEIKKENFDQPVDGSKKKIVVENETVKTMVNEKYMITNCRELKNDCKWTRKINIPLVRCDLTTAWKRYYRNGSINVQNIDPKQLLPKDLLKTNRISKSPASMNSNSNNGLVDLRKNPDFNLKLKRLSKKFLKCRHNQRLLGLCKPVSVVLDKMDMSSVSAAPAPLRKAKKVELPDIDEVRKINSTILTAEVAPVAVQNPTQVAQSTSNTSASEGQSTVTSNKIPKHIKNLMGHSEFEPDITDAQLKKVLNEMWAQTEKTTLVSNDDGKSEADKNVGSCVCESIQVETNKPHENQLMFEIRDRNIHESREVAYNVSIITRKKYETAKPLNTEDEVDYEDAINDNDTIMSSHSSITVDSSNEDCLVIDETEKEIKETGNERKTKRRRKRKVKCKERKPEDEPNRKKKKSKQTEEKDQTCSDAYDEWTRQKNLALKYFSLPSFVKPKDKEAVKITKAFTTSDANTSGPTDVPCPNVIKAFYESTFAAQRHLHNNYHNLNLSSGILRLVRPKATETFRVITKQPPNQTDNTKQASVIDLTETPNDEEPTSEMSPTTIIRAINFSNANITPTRPTIQRTCYEIDDVCTTCIDDEQTPPDDMPLPIITGVCSLAKNRRISNKKINKYAASLLKKLHGPQILNETPELVSPASEVPAAPLLQTSPEDFASLVPIPPPLVPIPPPLVPIPPLLVPASPITVTSSSLTTNTPTKSLPMVTVSPLSESPSVQSPWLPLPATNSTASIPQSAFQPIIMPSVPSQEKSSHNNKRRRNLAQVRTINTEAGRYFVLVPESMLYDVPKTAKFLLKRGLSPSKTMLVPVPPEEASQQLPGLVSTLQFSKSVRCQSSPVVTPNITETNDSQNVCLPVETWVQGKTPDELKILRIDSARPLWTPREGYLLITDSDLVCEMPTYWTVESPESRHRIMFPGEYDGFTVYNPKPVQVFKSAAIGTTAFAEWVRSVLEFNTEVMENSDYGCNGTKPTIEDVVNTAEPITMSAFMRSKPVDDMQEGKADVSCKAKVKTVNETVLQSTLQCNVVPLNNNETKVEKDGESKPVARLKVKSFARIRDDECEQTFPPERVCLQGKIYQKVSDEPLNYAQVFTVVSSSQETRCLSTRDLKFYILPNNTESMCAQAQT